VTVVNTGLRAWDPARVHVSYHWLWLVPRETIKRSRWDLPYHDGIRSELSDRAETIAPGARVALQGRILAPAIPGLYWLQWDMVEEGEVWFAQVAPRQPRTLVIVIPTRTWLFGPLPLLVALAGYLTVRYRAAPAVAQVADVLWCAAALGAKPLILVHEALLEPTAVAYWLIAVMAVVPPVLALLVLPRRVRAWTLLALGLFGSALVLADVVYYRFFGDVMSAPAVLAARQTGRVWGTIRSIATPELLWLILDWPIAVWLTVHVSRLRGAGPRLGARLLLATATAVVFGVLGTALGARYVLTSTPLDQMFRDRSVVEQFGPFGYHAYDLWNYGQGRWLHPPSTDAQLQDALAWFAERAPMRAGPGSPGFGAARGKNLIVVQVESLQDFAVDFRVNGQAVMPHLRQWEADSLRFTNMTDQTSEGRTSDAEFTTMASLLPMDHGAVAFRYPGNHYVALPRVLAGHGYSTLSAVAFEPGFWNRQVMHPSYGFQASLFEADFRMTEQIGWGLNDRDFLKQMVPRLERLPRPFCVWLITLSLHHPYDGFPASHKVLELGALENTPFGNYLHTMRFFDEALETFKASLARDGLLDESVLVVFGDHDAGFPRDRTHAKDIGIGADEISWALNDRVPLFVRLPGPRNLPDPDPRDPPGLRGARSAPAGQTDMAPTLLALLGIDPGPLPYVGRNLLASVDAPVMRPYGDWLDADHLFLTRAANAVCYDLHRRAAVPASGCSETDRSARAARQMSRLVITEDLQQRLRDRMQP
jgi:phosphoglycerol transferase MdoB-like AlkP superfamily enzyme